MNALSCSIDFCIILFRGTIYNDDDAHVVPFIASVIVYGYCPFIVKNFQSFFFLRKRSLNICTIILFADNNAVDCDGGGAPCACSETVACSLCSSARVRHAWRRIYREPCILELVCVASSFNVDFVHFDGCKWSFDEEKRRLEKHVHARVPHGCCFRHNALRLVCHSHK